MKDAKYLRVVMAEIVSGLRLNGINLDTSDSALILNTLCFHFEAK